MTDSGVYFRINDSMTVQGTLTIFMPKIIATGDIAMSDLKAYIRKRKKSDFEFKAGFDEGYKAFKIEVLVRLALSACQGGQRGRD